MTTNSHHGSTTRAPRSTIEKKPVHGQNERPYGRKIHYKRSMGGRRVFIEQARLCMMLTVTGLLLLSVETTEVGRIDLPGMGAASPSLGLLFCMAVGFLWREEEGAVAGLLTGWLADATGTGGMMLSPLLYCLCGYLAGLAGHRRLAHNLPSFAVFALLGGGVEAIFTVLREALMTGGLPPLAWTLRGCIPVWLLTVLASPAVYGILYAEGRLLGER